MPQISIYGTVYNNAYVIDQCINSLLRALPDFEENYELVIVDNYSTDGTFEKLLRLKRRLRNLKIIRARCTRGKGRDIALRETSGEYVMFIDFDSIFNKIFGDLVKKLREVCHSGEMWNFCFSTRSTMVDTIGGWRNLNFGEDWELIARAIRRGVRRKIVAIKTPIRNIRSSPGGCYGEQRYAGNRLRYLSRRLRNVFDATLGLNLKPPHILSIGPKLRPSVMAMLLFSAFTSLNSLKGFKEPAKAIAYANTQYVFPEELNLPRELFYISWEDPQLYWPIIRERIRELLKRDKRIKFKLNAENRPWTLMGYRER